jgi:5-formyltetrahydrofolate cyclo-ligase
LREFKERVPITGLAFDCQISKEHLPFDYHDIAMDQVITESGLLIKKTLQSSSEVPAG